MSSKNLEQLISEVGPYFNTASMFSSQRRFPEAIDKYKDVIKRLHELEVYCQYSDKTQPNLIENINQNLYHAYVDIGNCYIDLDQPNFGEASRSFLNSLVYGREPATIGNLLYCMGQINEFISEKVMTVKQGELTKQFISLHNEGYDLFKSDSISEAANILHEAIKINSNFAPTYHLLGLIFEKMQEDDLAVKSWLKVLELEYDFDFETIIKIQLS